MKMPDDEIAYNLDETFGLFEIISAPPPTPR